LGTPQKGVVMGAHRLNAFWPTVISEEALLVKGNPDQGIAAIHALSSNHLLRNWFSTPVFS
jgi:hypothetical protein